MIRIVGETRYPLQPNEPDMLHKHITKSYDYHIYHTQIWPKSQQYQVSKLILQEIRTVDRDFDWLTANVSKEMCNSSKQMTGASSEQTNTWTTYTRIISSKSYPCVCEARHQNVLRKLQVVATENNPFDPWKPNFKITIMGSISFECLFTSM